MGRPVLDLELSLSRSSSEGPEHALPALNKHQLGLGVDFCQHERRRRGFSLCCFSSLTASLINLRMESTAQFAVCCLLFSHCRAKLLSEKLPEVALFSRNKKGVEWGHGTPNLTTTGNLTQLLKLPSDGFFPSNSPFLMHNFNDRNPEV